MADMLISDRPQQVATDILGGPPNTPLPLYMRFVYLVRSLDYLQSPIFLREYCHSCACMCAQLGLSLNRLYRHLASNIISLLSRDGQITDLPLPYYLCVEQPANLNQ